MIRLVQRRLIVPRGDTGTFSIPILAGKDSGDAAIFTVFDPLMHRKIFEKAMTLSDGALGVDFTHNDTVNLPVGQYVWDIKFYTDPLFVDGKLVGGTEVDSYYSAFTLPICEIRETGDNLLMSDDAPTGALRPGQVDIITASIREITSLKESAAESAAEADTSATNAESSASAAATSAQDALDSKVAALAAQQTASAASESATSAAANAQASATLAAQRANEVMVELGTKANIEDLATVAFSGLYSDLSGVPTQVSQFINDAGYLTQHQDISGKANLADLATVATSGSYNDLEDKPTIPDIQINGNTITNNGIANIPIATTSDLGVIKVTSGYGIFTTKNGQILVQRAVPAAIKAGNVQYYFIDTAGQHTAAFYGLAKAAGDSTQSISTNAVGTYTNEAKEAIQTMLDVPSNADIPTLVSQLTNDAGYITGYTETDPTVPAWAKAAQKPTYTAAEVGAPTVQEMNDAIAAVNTMKLHICTQNEYNSETGVPTVQNPDTETFYLVPGGDSNNLFIEWAYVNNAWERFGSADVDLSNYATLQDIPEVPVQDIQVDGASILDAQGVANVPIATRYNAGVVKILSSQGISLNNNGQLQIEPCGATGIRVGTDLKYPIVAGKQHYSVFYGLAKAAGDTTQSVSTNAVGTYTPEAKEAIQQMLDVPSKSEVQNLISISTTAPSGEDAKIWIDTDDSTTVQVPTVAEMNLALAEKADIEDIPDVPVEDVQVNGTSILSNGVADIPIADVLTTGLVMLPYPDYGIRLISSGDSAGGISVYPAGTSQIKTADSSAGCTYRPITPKNQHYSVFYGLATAAGDTTQKVSTNAVGTYTADAKAAIQSMLGIDLSLFATKADTVLTTTLSRGRKSGTTIGTGSFAFGNNIEASGQYSFAIGASSIASGTRAFACGNTTRALGNNSVAIGANTEASGAGSYASGIGTIANATFLYVQGKSNVAAPLYPSWQANYDYHIGDKVSSNLSGYICLEDCNDSNWVSSHWQYIGSDSNIAFIFGNGNADKERSNAYALEWTGTAHYAGDVYVNCNNDSTGGTRLATVTEVAAKLDAAEAGLKVVRLI